MVEKPTINIVGGPALVKAGDTIYYGVLEKLDTRAGTALLTEAYIVNPQEHITFTQFLDAVRLSKDRNEEAKNRALKNVQEHMDLTANEASEVLVNHIVIFNSELQRLSNGNVLTSFSSGGIKKVERLVYRSGGGTIGRRGIFDTSSGDSVSLAGVTTAIPLKNDRIICYGDYLSEGDPYDTIYATKGQEDDLVKRIDRPMPEKEYPTKLYDEANPSEDDYESDKIIGTAIQGSELSVSVATTFATLNRNGGTLPGISTGSGFRHLIVVPDRTAPRR